MTQTLRSSTPRSRRPLGLLVGIALLATGCPDDDDPVSQVRTPTVARYAPSAGAIPLPNDLLFSGSVDGTLNAPVADPMNTADPTIALNTLDGASTSAPIVVEFSRGIDAATLVAGSTVRVFEVTDFVSAQAPVGGPVVSVDNELVGGTDYIVEVATEYPGGSALRIVPLRPLGPSVLGDNGVYMVVVTTGVQDTECFPVAKDTEYVFASEPNPYTPPTPPELIQLQLLVNAQLTQLEAATGVTRDQVAVSFTFSTQSVGSGLSTVLGIANGQEAAIIANLCAQLGTCGGDTMVSPFSTPIINIASRAPSIGTASELIGGAPGDADIWVASFQAPYYSTAATNTTFSGVTNDPAPVSTTWSARYPSNPADTEQHVTRFNPLPLATDAEAMPVLVSVPNSGMMPPGGWPVAIYVHAIGQSRTNLLGVAETLADAGFAAVAIDLPLHGVDTTTGMLEGGVDIFSGYDENGDLRERTFGLDLFTEPLGGIPSPGPDGIADTSGIHFYNVQNLAVARDNIQQGISDLMNLRTALAGLALPAGAGGDVFDESNVHFVGHSFGAMVGAPFVALQAGVPGSGLATATFGMGGGQLPYLLNGSTSFGPVIAGALALVGVQPNTPDYSRFLAVAQAVVDSGDPINYAAAIGVSGLPVYATEIVGGGGLGGMPDLVVPNSVPGAPLAGTEPFVAQMGLTSISMTTNDPAGIQGIVRFLEGEHSSFVTPGLTNPPPPGSAAAYAEIQAQLMSFLMSNGQDIVVMNGGIVQ